jgi:amino acid adenylation domain-containing protein
MSESSGLPLTTAQRGLWLAQQAAGLQTPNVISEWFGFDEKLDAGLFRRAVTLAVRDFHTLNTKYIFEGGLLRQEIDPAGGPDCPLIDLAHENDPSAAIDRWIVAERGRLVHAEGLRHCAMPLFRLPGGHYRWCVQFLHIASDGYTGMLWAQRVAQIYSALCAGSLVPKQRLGTLHDLLDEEQSYRASSHYERDRSYWREVTSALGAAVTLSTRDCRKGAQTITQTVTPSEELHSQLLDKAGKAGIPLSSFLLALTAIYVFRVTGEPDFTVGYPVTARINRTLRHTPGSLSSILPLTLTVDPGRSLTELARGITAKIKRLLRHQRYRIEDIRRDLGLLPQDPPLHRVSINFLSFDYAIRFGESSFSVVNGSTGDLEDLNFEFYDRRDGRGVSIQMKFHGGLYSSQEAAAHSKRFGELLDRVGREADRPIGEIPLLSEEERKRVLYGWNGTASAYPTERCVHEIFEAQAERTPDAIAVVHEAQFLCYAELNTRANRLARHLVGLGVRPDDRIAIGVERSLELVVGLLAILKAGAAYVPLDPHYPVERLSYMLTDSAPVVVLTHAPARAAVDAALGTATTLIDLEADARLWADQPGRNIEPRTLGLAPDHLAYIIYTSGSTGQPKGVMVEHGHLTARLTGVRDTLDIRPQDRMPIVSSIAFDISLLEMLLPLVSGASLRITDARRIRDMDYLQQQTRDASVFNAVTSLMQAWLNAIPQQDGGRDHPAMRALLVGGEPVSQRLLNQATAAFPASQVVETYGPTEATLFCTSCIAEPNEDVNTLPPIGRPLPNSRIYILDARGQPVPIGVTGELHIGGAGVARGYLNRPDLTAERFLDDPFADVPGARMYRTGDLGRWRTDGNIEFLGRSDFQVKLRGFRIELGEIEARLAEHAAVREAVVLVREDQPGDQRLVAYAVPAPHTAPEAEVLRTHLAAALPEHMVPAAYVVMDALPLSPNGKLDRKALPAPDLAAFTTSAFEPPQGEIEALIAAIWQQLLGLDRVGRTDNFFNLGGNSLLAIKLIERLRQRDLQVDIRSLFNTPTLAKLAQTITTGSRIEIPPNRIPNTASNEALAGEDHLGLETELRI